MKPILFVLTAVVAAVGGGCVIRIEPLPASFQSSQYTALNDYSQPQPPQRERRLREPIRQRGERQFYSSSQPSPVFYQQSEIPSSTPFWKRSQTQIPYVNRQRDGYRQSYLQPQGKQCICWEYVKNRIPTYPGSERTPINARKLEEYAFQEAGFRRYERPVPGAIALYQGNVLGAGPTGHVEIVESVDSRGVPTVSTSGKEIPPRNPDSGCSNVWTGKRPQLAKAQPGVSYWRL